MKMYNKCLWDHQFWSPKIIKDWQKYSMVNPIIQFIYIKYRKHKVDKCLIKWEILRKYINENIEILIKLIEIIQKRLKKWSEMSY